MRINTKRASVMLVVLAIIILTTVLFLRNQFGSSPPIGHYNLTLAFGSTTFTNPVGIISPTDSSGTLFIIEQSGKIQLIQRDQSGTWTKTDFLDIRSRVVSGGEFGLLGLAFHPQYGENGFLYVDYTASDPTRTVIARFSVSSTNNEKADPGSERILIEIPQPYSFHKGGQLAFGPDGYLYIGVGDGGPEGDPLGNGQNRSTLLGKILRIDVDQVTSGKNYTIPQDNPFNNNTTGYRDEIYAYGFRNPWRFSFDPAKGVLWVGDVGQNRMEEVDIVKNGGNYGWNIVEGTLCYSESNCDATMYEAPIYIYNHTLSNSAVIGGYVYRGERSPELQGQYIFGDYGSGRIWALSRAADLTIKVTELVDSGYNITSFGLDEKGELYLSTQDGQIYTLTK